jgi:hypothetical protein
VKVVDHKARIDTLGLAIVRKRMQAPVLFFLEMHRPLAGLCSSLLTAGGPLIGPFIGREWIETIQYLLQTPSELEGFMSRLEQGVSVGGSHGRN